jgi:7-cyano-7-deazaguanine synthase
MDVSPNTALVLFSGGQDSTVCLAWALERFARVETVGFEYGQRHVVEMAVRPRVRERLAALRADWAGRLGDDHVVKLDALAAISDTALTREMQIEIAESGLPNTFVPGRNIVFLAFAAALGYRVGQATWSPACAKPTIPAIPIAATKPSRRCKPRSGSAWIGPSCCTRH